MAIVKKRSIAIANLSGIKAFIDSFNNPLVTTEVVSTTHSASSGQDLVITFENKGTVTLYKKNGWVSAAYDFPHGISADRGIRGLDTLPITICSGDDFFYFEFEFDNFGYCTFVFVYDKVSVGSTLFGIDGFYPGTHECILDTNMTVCELESGAEFTYGRPLNYTATTGTIQYIDHATVLNGGVKTFDDNILKSCTKVTPRTVITFSGQNYYVIGNNTLIPIDSQT